MITADAFLGGRLRINQPALGFRAGMDSVFLAAAVPAGPGSQVLELGSGNGAASLCLARRVEEAAVMGLEIQPDLASLANENAAANGLGERVRVIAGAVEAPPSVFAPGTFDHVMLNPPFFVDGPDDPSPDAARRLANSADAAALARWAATARKYLNAKGTLTAILPASRLPAMLAALEKGFGAIRILPLWPRVGEPAKRVLIGATKGSRTVPMLLAGLTLHAPPLRHTAEAEAVLRDGASVALHASMSRPLTAS